MSETSKAIESASYDASAWNRFCDSVSAARREMAKAELETRAIRDEVIALVATAVNQDKST